MKKLSLVLGGLLLLAAAKVLAQPPVTAPPAEAPQLLQPGAESIRGIIILPNDKEINRAGVTGIKGVVVKGPEFLRRPDFEQMLQRRLGQPLTKASLDQMQVEIIQYSRGRGHLIVDVYFPEQDIVEGTIQIAVIEGRVGKVTVLNDGRHWFSDDLILSNVRLRPGDVVVQDRLNSDLNWLNQNTFQSVGVFDGSFRDVTASFQQGALGETDIQLHVRDRFPFRPFVGFENTGISVIGEERLFAGFNYANLFGIDHRLNYQYTTDTEFDRFRSHAASYVVPFPWRHELILFGAYSDLDPDFSVLRTDSNFRDFKNEGTTWQTSARYSIVLPRIRNYDHALTLGFDFKRTDTPLTFGSFGLLQTNQIDVAQFSLEYGGAWRDAFGRTAFSVQGVYSPGDLTEFNTDEAFNEFSRGTDAEYVYGRAEVRRETFLPLGFSWFLRAAGQYADSKLAPTEQFGLGGWATVRGYNERVVNGDHGYLIINELRTRRFVLGNLLQLPNAVDWIQALAFFDYGRGITIDPTPGNHHNDALVSVGAGFRYVIAENFHLRFDYGFQLDRSYKTLPAAVLEDQPTKKGHVGLELSF